MPGDTHTINATVSINDHVRSFDGKQVEIQSRSEIARRLSDELLRNNLVSFSEQPAGRGMTELRGSVRVLDPKAPGPAKAAVAGAPRLPDIAEMSRKDLLRELGALAVKSASAAAAAEKEQRDAIRAAIQWPPKFPDPPKLTATEIQMAEMQRERDLQRLGLTQHPAIWPQPSQIQGKRIDRIWVDDLTESPKPPKPPPPTPKMEDVRAGLVRQLAGRAAQLPPDPDHKTRQALEWARGIQHNIIDGASGRTIIAAVIVKLSALLETGS